MAERGKTEKLSVTLPRDLAEEVRSVIAQGNLSAFLTKAAEYYLAYCKQQAALEKGFGGWKEENHPEIADSAAYVHSLREADKRRMTGPGDAGAR